MLDRILSRRTYVLVDVALVLMALMSIGLAQVDLRGWNSIVALVIAAAKAAVIALFFMELKFASGLHRLVGVAAILWLGILMVGTLDDLLTRGWLPVPGK